MKLKLYLQQRWFIKMRHTCGAVVNRDSNVHSGMTVTANWWSMQSLELIIAEEKLCWSVELKAKVKNDR